MRVRFLTCFITVLCTQAISILGLHGNYSSEHRALNSSNSNMETKQPTNYVGNYGSIKEGIKLRREDKKYIKEEKFEPVYVSIKKANRGKGANGGANDNHRSEPRRSGSSAPSMLSWISTVCVSFVLISVFSFHAKLL